MITLIKTNKSGYKSKRKNKGRRFLKMSADLTSVYFQNMKERIIRILIRGKRKTYTNTESKNQTTNKNTKSKINSELCSNNNL